MLSIYKLGMLLLLHATSASVCRHMLLEDASLGASALMHAYFTHAHARLPAIFIL
jgi:hypothetical protein